MRADTDTLKPRLRFRAFLAAGLALVLLAAPLAACSPAAEDADETVAQESALPISVSITVSNGETVLVEEAAKEVPIETTALDAVQSTGLEVAMEDSEYGVYVTSIAGIAADASHGWTYSVNGEEPVMSAGDCILQEGDALVWSYVSFDPEAA